MPVALVSDNAVVADTGGVPDHDDDPRLEYINRRTVESLEYEQAQLARLTCDPKNVRAFIADVHAGLRTQGFVRRGRTLVIEGDEGQVGELRLHTAYRAPSPCALLIYLHLRQRIRHDGDQTLDPGWTFVADSEFRAERPMTGLYDEPETSVARLVLIDPSLPGQTELLEGVVQFGRQWAKALSDSDAYVELLPTAVPGIDTLTGAEYRRLRLLTQGGDLSRLEAAFRVVDARIPNDAWMRSSEGLRQIINAAEGGRSVG